ncbi:MAG: hypothetical protein RLZZ231_859 [Bacteroidota bacterium]|jgi:hypothetical protein
MNIQTQIDAYMASLPEIKRQDMHTLHQLIFELMPTHKLWFLDGKNEAGKIVSNPNVGYGNYTIHYADGTTKDFFQIGISGNTTGISVYIMGLDDKTYLPTTFGATLGKATVTGYCIKFKHLKDIHLDVLKEAVKVGFLPRKKG